jgi:hypothetical protein
MISLQDDQSWQALGGLRGNLAAYLCELLFLILMCPALQGEPTIPATVQGRAVTRPAAATRTKKSLV